ncbi:MAG: HK97 gp10 family phage protein [Chloroflexota bacterium]|nr:HK97 gp10 family phage protein [Chloroflexota bacterium]
MINAELLGGEKLLKKLDNLEQLLGEPLRHTFQGSAELIEGEVKLETPRDVGHLAQSITHEVDSATIPLYAKVGTNKIYAQAVEFGTKPHWTSVKNLEGWARRHHVNPYAVQQAIAKRGTPPHKMFSKGWKSAEKDVIEYFEEVGNAIEQRWQQ